MRINKIGFSGILRDNDMHYLSRIFSKLKEIDDDLEVNVYKTLRSYSFCIVPSNEEYIRKIIKGINKFHKELGLKIEYSRSMKISNIISFYLI